MFRKSRQMLRNVALPGTPLFPGVDRLRLRGARRPREVLFEREDRHKDLYPQPIQDSSYVLIECPDLCVKIGGIDLLPAVPSQKNHYRNVCYHFYLTSVIGADSLPSRPAGERFGCSISTLKTWDGACATATTGCEHDWRACTPAEAVKPSRHCSRKVFPAAIPRLCRRSMMTKSRSCKRAGRTLGSSMRICWTCASVTSIKCRRRSLPAWFAVSPHGIRRLIDKHVLTLPRPSMAHNPRS